MRFASRQVHLDFHTSEHIPGVGSRFCKEAFQGALRTGKVNSITVFAKCHHGWCYYPSKVDRVHPTLDFDLTGSMVEAAHEIGVRAPIYITVGWSAKDAEEHPEWTVRDRAGNNVMSRGTPDAVPGQSRPETSWKYLCPGSGYGELVYAVAAEICNRYPVVDGLFFDISFGPLCWCDACVAEMTKAGLDPDKDSDAKAYHVIKWQRVMTRCADILHARHKDATLFFNGGANPKQPQWHPWQTHFEMEDLPTTGGGYDKMPARAAFFAATGKAYMGMTGKFHTAWGEFGGFKSPQALTYECAAMLTYGARCSVGDQMHPSGEMDLETYRLIGQAYGYVESIEPWCFDGVATSRLAVWLSGDAASDEGLVKTLLEKQLDFRIVTEASDWSSYDVIVLPDHVLLDDEAAERLSHFVRAGGGALLTGWSGLDPSKTRLMVDIGVEFLGPANYEVDYLIAGSAVSEGLVRSPFLFYEAANRVKVLDADVLAAIREPYFNRTYGRYCSHRNTPYRLEDAEHPGAVQKGNVIYLAHPVCRLYREYGAQVHRDYLANALRVVYKEPVLQVRMPSMGRARLIEQPRESRYVCHLLYGSPIRRGKALVIEDLPPLYDVPVRVRVPRSVKRVYLAPQMEEISFHQEIGQGPQALGDRESRGGKGTEANIVTLTVPKVQCHQIVVFDY